MEPALVRGRARARREGELTCRARTARTAVRPWRDRPYLGRRWSLEHSPAVGAATFATVGCWRWAAEDACRAPGVTADEVASLKRRIDALNACRVALVEQIDVWAEGEIGHVGAGMLHTETLGSVVDRLAVAWVRANNLAAAGDQPFLARRAWRQLAELAEAYDGLVTEVAGGRRRLPAWRPLKSYRAGAAGGQ
jgi:Protein of unknown function (DUF4254)